MIKTVWNFSVSEIFLEHLFRERFSFNYVCQNALLLFSLFAINVSIGNLCFRAINKLEVAIGLLVDMEYLVAICFQQKGIL